MTLKGQGDIDRDAWAPCVIPRRGRLDCDEKLSMIPGGAFPANGMGRWAVSQKRFENLMERIG